MTAKSFKEGDIFRWRWTEEVEKRRYSEGVHMAYWCKSRIAVIKDGVLQDTYWGSSDSSVLDPAEVILDFQGNANEMRTIPSGEEVFYRPEDIMDMGHPNNSRAPVYVKGNATRDREVMKEYYDDKIVEFERELSFIRDRLARCNEVRNAVVRGELDGCLPVYSSKRG